MYIYSYYYNDRLLIQNRFRSKSIIKKIRKLQIRKSLSAYKIQNLQLVNTMFQISRFGSGEYLFENSKSIKTNLFECKMFYSILFFGIFKNFEKSNSKIFELKTQTNTVLVDASLNGQNLDLKSL